MYVLEYVLLPSGKAMHVSHTPTRVVATWDRGNVSFGSVDGWLVPCDEGLAAYSYIRDR